MPHNSRKCRPFSIIISLSYSGGILGLRLVAFTCVGWQVTLCDPIWQLMPRSFEMDLHHYLFILTAVVGPIRHTTRSLIHYKKVQQS